MCDRLILEQSRYICEDCWKELLEFRNDWLEETQPSEVRALIEQFMESRPGSFSDPRNGESVDLEFKRLTEQSE